MKINLLHPAFVALCLLASPAVTCAKTDADEVLAIAVHIDTEVGGGRYGLREIAGFLEENGVDGAVISDHDNAEITYGLPPFRSVVKKTRSFPSIEQYGPVEYLSGIEQAAREHPELILIPGAEAVPFYYWEGNPIRKNLTLMNWQEHMLVLGMNVPEHYKNLPAIHRGPGKQWNWFGVLALFLPAGMIVAGVGITRMRIENKLRFDRLTYKTVSRWPIVPGVFIIVLAVLVLIEMSPFHKREIDQYHGDRGALPYQKLINYADSIGALTFWAHPEASVDTEYEGVMVRTEPYHEHLLETTGYDGFAIFWNGDREIGSPGGIWDQVLLQYTAGEREKPVWAIGELDWEGVAGGDLIAETLTICYADERSADGVLAAMKSGRMIAVRNGVWKKIEAMEFSVVNEAGQSVSNGGEMTVTLPPEIRLAMEYEADCDLLSQVQLVRNGEIIARDTLESGSEWVFRDTEAPRPGKTWYYRMTVGRDFPVVATNPVFVIGSDKADGA